MSFCDSNYCRNSKWELNIPLTVHSPNFHFEIIVDHGRVVCSRLMCLHLVAPKVALYLAIEYYLMLLNYYLVTKPGNTA